MLDESRDSPWGTTQREQKKGLEFGEKEYDEINKYCKSKNIESSLNTNNYCQISIQLACLT